MTLARCREVFLHMSSEPSLDAWRDILDAIDDEPPALKVADALADARELSTEQAQQRTYEAIDAGVLVENGDGFGYVELADEYNRNGEAGRDYLPENSPDPLDVGDDTRASSEDEATSTGSKGGGNTDASRSSGLESGENRDSGEESHPDAEEPEAESWHDVEFSAPGRRHWAPLQTEFDHWMCREESKAPFSPWADADAPVECTHNDHDTATTCDHCEHHAGYKWGSRGSGEYVHADHDTAREWAEKHPNLSDDLVFIQRESDPFAFVDGDDVRCPDTGEVHPAFVAILEHLGLTYADVSTSGSGVHAVYRGEVSIDGKGQASFELDVEPWGENDSPPTIEFYANKHVCIATGDHVPGSGTEVHEWDHDVLETILKANGYDDKEVSHDTDTEREGLSDYSPDATSSDDTTTDIRDLFVAVDRLGPDDLRLRTTRTGQDSTGWSTWDPSYRTSESGESLHYNGEGAFYDHKEGEEFGVLALLAAEEGIIRNPWGDLNGSDWWEAVEAARDDGAAIPEYVGDQDHEPAEALLDQDVVVEPVNALRAAEAVQPDHLDEPLPELERADVDDVAIAVAIAEGVINSPDEFPENGRYTDCYYRARDHYGAPLPKYLDNSTLEERDDLVLAALDRITPEHILDNIKSEVTVEDPAGQAVAKINPVWEDSESGERILAGYGHDGFLCLEHGPGEPDGQQTFSPLQFVAVENDLIDFEYDYPRGENFKQAYRLLREEYGAPLPKWRKTVLEHFAVLPPAVDLVDGASARRSLSDVHADVEELIRDALTVRDRAQLVTVFPGGGKTYSAAKAAVDTPLLYVAGRNELKEQIENYAREVSADTDRQVTVVHLPILAENQIQDAALREAVGVVRERGGLILKQREELLDAVDEPLDAEDSEDSQDVDIKRATCPTAEGEHGPAWRLVVQTARELGLDPSVIHQYDTALFGEELPCQHAGDCEYALGWESVRDPDDQADILVGSPGHAYVDSATTYFDRDENGDRITRPRAVVIDEFPEDEYFAQFGDTYMDHATWLSEALVGIDTREGVIQADLDAHTWVDLWLDGDGDEYVPAASVVDRLQAGQAIAAARSLAEDLRDDGLPREVRLDTDSLTEALDTLASGDGTTDLPNLDGVQKRLSAAVSRLETDAANAYARGEDHAGALYALADDLGEITENLAEADRLGGDLGTLAEELEDSLDELPIGGDLRALCQDAVAVIRGEDDRDDLLRAAVESLTGGREGCQELAIYADDGYAHPQAWKLLAGAVATPESSGVSEVSTGQFSFDDAEGGTFKRLKRNRAVVAACQNHKGALVSDTPEFTDIGGAKCPVVGLDATGRTRLWRLAIGRDTERRDIHDSPAERRGFLRDVMNLRVVQTSETANAYFSDPRGKNFGEDLELVDTVTDEFTGYGPDVIDTKAPAVITSKKVMNHLREPLADALGVPADATYAEDSPLVNFGDMKGSDALGERQVGVILGSPHYGDQEPEKWALVGGEDAAREDGYGMNLDYGSETANAYLKNMREDHVMQAILRAGRNDDATVVFAHTAALREDLPVDYQAVTLTAHSKGTLAVAEAAKTYRDEPFTVQDVVDEIRDDQDAVDERQVRNILAELAGEGYLRRVREGGPGVAHEFELEEDPGTADIDLPEPEIPETSADETSEKSRTGALHTWNFRSPDGSRGAHAPPAPARATIPAREALGGDGPPPTALQ
jgi:hypothetical protein